MLTATKLCWVTNYDVCPLVHASVTHYKTDFGSSSPTPYKKPSYEVKLLICVRGYMPGLETREPGHISKLAEFVT